MPPHKFYIVAVGSAAECAKIMGISLESFRCAVTRSRSGENKKYEIDVEQGEYDEQ